MTVAQTIAQTFSKDQSTKVGALIISMDGSPLSWGYNGICRGVLDDIPERLERPEKYKWFEHAERNAIYNATRAGVRLIDSRIFITKLAPCVDCCRGIIQSGISEVYMQVEAFNEEGTKPAWLVDFKQVKEMFGEAGVGLYVIK